MHSSDKQEASGLWIFQAAASEASSGMPKHQCCQHLRGQFPARPNPCCVSSPVCAESAGESASSLQLLKKAFGNREKIGITSHSCLLRHCSSQPTGPLLPLHSHMLFFTSLLLLLTPFLKGSLVRQSFSLSITVFYYRSLKAAGYHRFGRRFIKSPTSVRSRTYNRLQRTPWHSEEEPDRCLMPVQRKRPTCFRTPIPAHQRRNRHPSPDSLCQVRPHYHHMCHVSSCSLIGPLIRRSVRPLSHMASSPAGQSGTSTCPLPLVCAGNVGWAGW